MRCWPLPAKTREARASNVEFLKGEIEHIPLPDNSVDVIISNCVINLSADKDRVIREAFRVLRPGGRFAVSDVVTRGQVPEQLRRDMLLWVGCMAGALDEGEYGASSSPQGSTRSASSRPVFTRSRTPANSSPARVSTLTRWQRMSTVNS